MGLSFARVLKDYILGGWLRIQFIVIVILPSFEGMAVIAAGHALNIKGLPSLAFQAAPPT